MAHRAEASSAYDVYLEVGQKKVFAGALDWPGWCRGAASEEAALAALVAYASRYAAIFAGAEIVFTPPDDLSQVTVSERLAGNSSTDFGAPKLAPARDSAPFDAAEHTRAEAILTAIWRAFDAAVRAAEGRALRAGPRGGGRNLDQIVRHVVGGDAGYLGRLAQRFSQDEAAPRDTELRRTRAAIHAALAAGALGAIPARGPRGGALWSPRYFVRRVAWHTTDHLWEIEDRVR